MIQIRWAFLLTLWAGILIWNGQPTGVAFVAIIAAHVYVTFKLHSGAKWAWWASWPLPVVALAFVAPMVIYNYFLYFTDDPRYLDSPGTILTIVVLTIVFVVPAMAIVALLVAKRRSLAPNTSLERTRDV